MNFQDWMLPCPTKKLFGIDCFGCGAQRAFVLVLEGRFLEAFQLFPAIYTTILFIILAIFGLFNKRRTFSIALVITGILNVLIMIFSYFYKHDFFFK